MRTLWTLWFKQAPEGDTTGGGGGSSTNTDPNADQNKTEDKSAARIAELEAALAKEQKEKGTLNTKVSSLAADIEKIRTQGLKSKEDYKTLSESLETQVTSLTQENTKLKDSIFFTTRVSAVKDEAVKLGLRSQALSDIEALDLDEIQVKVGDDKIIRVEGAGDFAKKLKTLKPYLFETVKDPTINTGGGGGGGGSGATVTQQQLSAAYLERNKSPEKMKAYRDTQKQFDEQTRKARATAK